MKGLSDNEVKKNRELYGQNNVNNGNKNSFIKLLIASFGDPIIKILLIALSIKVMLFMKNFDWYETIGIVIAIGLASFISAISEYGSNKAFLNLQSQNSDFKVIVLRDNKLKKIKSQEVVYGDIIKVSSGDRIPSDGILLSGELTVDESFLTGEAQEIIKEPTSIKNSKVFSGSSVYKGNGIYRTTAVGKNTVMGKLSLKLQEENEDSPLKKRLRVLANQISKLGYLGAILASLTYLFVKIFIENDFIMAEILSDLTNPQFIVKNLIYCLTMAVTIIIMAVPEGLPMMITLVLSSNMKKMLKDNVLVRRLAGIEASGSLNVLLCDKTGTLTEGKLKVESVNFAFGKKFFNINEITFTNKFKEHLTNSLLLNNEAVVQDNKIINGNSTDQAIAFFAKELKCKDQVTERVPFSSETKYSEVKATNGYTYYKGASEILLKKCNSYLDFNGNIIKDDFSKIKQDLEKQITEYSLMGYRIIFMTLSNSSFQEMTFVSYILIADQVRSGAKESIEQIENAGIKVIMITGDSPDTAANISQKLSLGKNNDLILTHSELKRMSDEQLSDILSKIKIIARALPEDKGRIVELCKKKGLIVGMTGDGINDSLALKKSDVGFALGSGCDVAKEAGDIVILDDNIKSICNAILYGRTIFKSIRRFIIYQLTVNICALFLSIIGPLIGIMTPITIVQMLWLNMIMDTFAGLAFSYEPPLEKYLLEKPKNPSEKILNKYMTNQIIINGLSSSIICLFFIKSARINHIFRDSPGNKYLLTGFFGLFIFLGIINSFLARTTSMHIFSNIKNNKVFLIINTFIILVQIYILYYGGTIFRTYGLTFKEMLITVAMSLLIIPIDFVRKLFLKINKKDLAI